MSRVGIVVALPDEAATLGLSRARVGDCEIIDGGRVMIAGMGARNAAAAADRLISYGVRMLLCWGIAGGLSPALRPGDVVVPERILASNAINLPVDESWHARTLRALADYVPVSAGALWSSDGPVASVGGKQALAARGAAAVDMECASVAAVAAREKVAFLAIKSICDPAARALPPAALALLGPGGRFRPRALPGFILGGPSVWLGAHALRRDFNTARQSLAHAAGALPVILRAHEKAALRI